MMKTTFAVLVLFGATLSVSAMRFTNSVNHTVDTRDYIFTVTSPYGEVSVPTGGVSTNSWRSIVVSEVAGYPVYEQSETTRYSPLSFSGEGTSPASGNGIQAWVKLTNVTSTLTWNWGAFYWVDWEVSGQGTVQPVNMNDSGDGAWCQEGEVNLIRAVPDAGWLFTGWSGIESAGPSFTNLYFIAPSPISWLASFSDDPDEDGLKNTNEWAIGANPWMADTDGDNYDDGFEVANGLSPTVDSAPFVTHIADNPGTYGLYASNAVLDIAVGQVALNIDGTTARLRLQVQQSEDLHSWTNAGEAVEWTLPVSGEKKFLRIRSGE